MYKTIVAFLEGRLLSSQFEQFKMHSKSYDWLEKAGPPNKPLLIWSCKQTISCQVALTRRHFHSVAATYYYKSNH